MRWEGPGGVSWTPVSCLPAPPAPHSLAAAHPLSVQLPGVKVTSTLHLPTAAPGPCPCPPHLGLGQLGDLGGWEAPRELASHGPILLRGYTLKKEWAPEPAGPLLRETGFIFQIKKLCCAEKSYPPMCVVYEDMSRGCHNTMSNPNEYQ